MNAMPPLILVSLLAACAQEPHARQPSSSSMVQPIPMKGRCWAVDGPIAGIGIELPADSVKKVEALIASGEWSLLYAQTAGHWTCGALQPLRQPERAQFWSVQCGDKHGSKPQSFIAADSAELREAVRLLVEVTAKSSSLYEGLTCDLLTAKVFSPELPH